MKMKKLLAFMLAAVMLFSMLPVAAASGFEKTETWSDTLFTDVAKTDWFYENVKEAYELGLMVGYGDGTFNPTGNITMAQTIAVAARVHAIATKGEESFEQGSPWYQVYVDYALANGILGAAAADYDKAATRLEFARILAKAMPEKDLKAINDVKYGDIPDVADDASVYMLYRAGVLMGNDEKGTFAPESTIQRSEMAAIVTRMALPELRIEKETEKKPTSGNIVIRPDDGQDTPEQGEPEQPEQSEDVKVTVEVENVDGKVNSEVSLEGETVKATVPAGVALEEGAKELTLTIDALDQTGSDVTAGENEALTSYDVHIAGVSADNTVVITVSMGEILSKGLNMGNVALYHVEDGVTNAMTQVNTLSDLDEHNEFYYDPATGEVTVALKSFSEVTLLAEEPKWEGKRDYTWYDASKTELTIANADQLAAFGAIVGGMAKDENNNFLITYTDSDGDEHHNDSFSGKTVKLICDINIGDLDSENGIVFYPIGYWNSDGTYEKDPNATTGISSGFYAFEGIFDGNGHTIANFYHNTWEMKGDNNYYDAKLQYYRDGMGLFGRVYGGTIKNLTVSNFSSDGEYTTTGCVAAYADGATFENIAIFDCNPRVYNIGNGGIVGCVGWYAKEANLKTTFTNITVDNSNKISALWSSYDVACGGLVGQYYPTSGQSSVGTPKNGGIEMVNCHVSAQMDVYNDVCGNYQYYAYRYAGMLIGSVRENVTIDGHSYPKMDGITAENCTVHFGDWNDYYYCELVANTTASYTHDHQMSRLEQVASVDATNMKVVTLKGEEVDIPTSGRCNYVVVKAKDTNGMWIHGDGADYATCYHFVNGAVWNHEDAGYHNGENGEKYIDENGDGAADLKEDKQLIYREFNNLVTGYGWGVTSRGLNNLDGVTNLDVEHSDNEKSVTKFAAVAADNSKYMRGTTVTIGDLFEAKDQSEVAIDKDNVQVFVSPADSTSDAGGTYTANTTDWTKGKLQFYGTGKAIVTITDYYYCKETTLNIEVTEPGFLYRVGNQNEVTYAQLAKLLTGKETYTTISVSNPLNHVVDIDKTATGVDFVGTGVVCVTIDTKEYYLEVVDAVNATAATSATKNNVVLLNDCDFSTIDVKNGYTLYGNGFTMTNKNDVLYHSLTVGFVTLENGTLDNVQIEVPNFSHAVLYNSNMTESSNYYDSNSQKYGNVRSAVITSGNSKILNSRVSGGRAAVYAAGGTIEIDNSTIVGGAAANIHVTASTIGLTLRDVTMIQEPTKATVHDTNKTLMGLSVLVMCDDDRYGAKITLEGYLNQYAWAHEDYKTYVPSSGQSVVSMVLKEADYIHQIEYADGTYDSLNLGFAFMSNGNVSPADPVVGNMIDDNRTDGKAYGAVNVNGLAYVYSYTNSNGTAENVKTKPVYSSEAQHPILPTVTYTDVNENRVFETKYDATNGWMSTLTVDVDAGSYEFSFDKLLAQKYGQKLNYTVKTADGTAADKTITLNDSSTNEYILTIKDDLIYGANGYISSEEVETEYTFKLLSTKTSISAPTWVSTTLNGTPLYVGDGKDTNWNVALPVLEGMRVKYYSKAQGKVVELALADVPLGNVGKKSDTNTYTLTVENEYTLTVTTTNFHSNDDGKPTVAPNPETDTNTLYFTATTYVSSGTASRSVGITYSFTDANNSPALTHNTTWKVNYNDVKNNTMYDPSKMFEGKMEETSTTPCFVEGTLITMADGTQKAVEDLVVGDMVLAFNHVTGQMEAAPIIFNTHSDELEARERDVLHLEYFNGEEVKIVGSHGLFDMTLMQYVYVDYDNYQDFIGHEFYYAGNDGTLSETVVLEDAFIEKELTRIFCPVSYFHMNSIANGFLNTPNIPGDITGLVNYFEYDEDLKYNEEAMQRDIETYGLYTYDDFKDYISYEAYLSSPSVYLKVAVGKGMITFEQILDVIDYLLAGSLIQ